MTRLSFEMSLHIVEIYHVAPYTESNNVRRYYVKRLIKSIIGIFIFIVIVWSALLLWKVYAEQHTDNSAVADLAKFNPLIQSENYYIKTQEPTKVDKQDNSHNVYKYKQQAVDKNGHRKMITFNAFSDKLKINHYLKVEVKLDRVQSYKEVSQQQVPSKALQRIDS